MAGVKRKLAATREPAAPKTSNPASAEASQSTQTSQDAQDAPDASNDVANPRVTRLGTRSTVMRNGRRSRIVILRAGGRVLLDMSQQNPQTSQAPQAPQMTQATQASPPLSLASQAATEAQAEVQEAEAARASEPAQEHQSQPEAEAEPEIDTPRPKRVRRTVMPDESPRTVRKSRRLNGQPLGADADETIDLNLSRRSPQKNPRSRNNRRAQQPVIQQNDSVIDEAPEIAEELLQPQQSQSSHAEPTEEAPVSQAANENRTQQHSTTPTNTSETVPIAPVESVVEPGPARGEASVPKGDDVHARNAEQSTTAEKNEETTDDDVRPTDRDGDIAMDDADPDFTEPEPKSEEEKEDLPEPRSHHLLPNGSGSVPSESVAEVAGESTVPSESRTATEDVEISTTEDVLAIAAATARGRGRGRGGRVTRARGRGGRNRGGARGRGRGGRARGGAATRESSEVIEIDPALNPANTALAQKLRERQRELDKTFKKVAAAQRLALSVLATHSHRRLARDKNAHKNVPEYDEVNQALREHLRAKENALRHEYELKVEQENRLYQAYTAEIQQHFRDVAQHIHQEHLLAAQGDYMAFVGGRQAAEDDEHTETDESDSEVERGIFSHLRKEFVRGYNSSFVRALPGAAAHERAKTGWEDFVQRAKLGGDLNPQMKEMSQEGDAASASAPASTFASASASVVAPISDRPAMASAAINLLLEAMSALDQVPDTAALNVLADLAMGGESSNAPPPPGLPPVMTTPAAAAGGATHRTILPQPAPQQQPQQQQVSSPLIPPGPTDPRSFLLPRPAPGGPQQGGQGQQQQHRRLLPAGQPLPPITDKPGRLDPFGGFNGPPQLPPPPGSNFQRPPMPGYLPGGPPPPPPQMYHPYAAPPPPPPPPPPAPPRNPYQ
ncbi:hypothetical protein ASPZODRAFT_13556 [Penicilliopsis zonata CBS 506.65]|uniref:Uncharacterized protein n=1 Tax=Penicilliopsis zonata CBS 506.65 TaxID=1073090 RepID=A0A1L9SNK9_9EURO|nr:hypothetical protein ASPZODRAFT_13556 [Penicilliopsis zonata CBS 506.65]OJJ48815.1 hypothetical protein ASPZODRAFT_13556 [Penicilliopsis zonata CBS 506.65]